MEEKNHPPLTTAKEIKWFQEELRAVLLFSDRSKNLSLKTKTQLVLSSSHNKSNGSNLSFQDKIDSLHLLIISTNYVISSLCEKHIYNCSIKSPIKLMIVIREAFTVTLEDKDLGDFLQRRRS